MEASLELGGDPQAHRMTSPAETPALAVIAAEQGEFLWLTLQRLGVRRADCSDVVQNVLLVVHRKLHTYDGRAPLRAWLYGICVKEASTHRRRAWVRREQPASPEAMAAAPLAAPGEDPERSLSAREQEARLEAMLDELDADKRAVLVMYEIEDFSCEEIASLHGIPLGTVHSRLHAARRRLRAVWDRWTKRDARGGTR